VIARPIKFALITFLLSFAALQAPAQLPLGPVTQQPTSSSNSSSSAPSNAPAPPQSQSPFQGSVPGKLEPGVIPISLQDAIDRGLKTNLGLLLSEQDIGSAHGERWKKLSALLPNITTTSYADGSQVDLAEFGFTSIPGATIPSIVGPFGYFDARAYLTQNLLDFNAINKTHAATQNLKAAQYTAKDARDLVVLAVGYNYLQAIADASRIESVSAQVNTAQALYDQASDQVKAGTSPAIDGLRAQVELKTRQQRLIQAKNDFAIQKLTLARVIGLAAGQQFVLTDKSPYDPFGGMTLDEALQRAYASRSDFMAASATLRAAEYTKKAAHAEYYPALSFSADYGVAGTASTLSTHGVFDVRGSLNIPIFQGGKVHGDELQARDQLLVRVIEMAVRDRRLVRTLQFDPVVVRLLAEYEPFQRFMERLYRVLLGDTGDDGRIEGAMLSGAISSAVMHPLVADVDDNTLLTKLTDMSRRLLGL